MAAFDDRAARELRLQVNPGELADISRRLTELAVRIPRVLELLKEANTHAYLNPETGLSALGSPHVPGVGELSANMTNTYLSVYGNLSAVAETLEATSTAVTGHARKLERVTGQLDPTED